jgi:hypothetical protein
VSESETVLSPEQVTARVLACREWAAQLDAAGALFDRLDIEGWARHFRRDAELLRIRAAREEEESSSPE